MLFRRFVFLLVAAQVFCVEPNIAQQSSQSTGDARVDALLAKMTLAEKIAMLHGSGEDAATYQGEAGYLAGIPRLGIPPMRLVDGPPGVLTRVPSIAPPSTMSLAATFSRKDAQLIGEVIGREARAHGASVALQPFINIARDFTFERAYNTFGEDPFLTAQLGAAQIKGIQSQRVMAQAKHYLGYDTYSRNVFIDEQTLHEVYLQPFRAAAAASVSSVMCSYNKINGLAACGNRDTLTRMLRDEIGFQGFVTSDWGADHGTNFINAGLDLEMSGPLAVPWNIPSYFVNQPKYVAPEPSKPEPAAITEHGLPEEPIKPAYEPSNEAMPTTSLMSALAAGDVTEAAITRAAGRILLQMQRFGYLDGGNKLDVTPSQDDLNIPAVEAVATDSAILMKNDAHILPLQPSQLADLAIIGPGGRQTVAVGLTGEKAVGIPALKDGPLAALQRLAGPSATIHYAVADDMEGTPVPASALSHFGEPGLVRRMWNENAVHIDSDVSFTARSGNELPAESSVVWTGTLTAPESGAYRVHLQLLGCYGKLVVDDVPVAKTWFNWIHGEVTQAGQDNIFPTTDGLDNLRATLPLTAGPHTIRLEVAPDTSHTPVQVRLSWVTPSQQRANYAAAIDAARHAKTAVVFAWSRTRPAFALPGDQDQLIANIAAVNPNTVVVLNVSQPVTLPWLAKAKCVLNMGWPGDRGGPATAKILLGLANPGGRLPYSWPKLLTDMPANDPAHAERSSEGVAGKTTFSEGLNVGYRWLELEHTQPAFPFGFGLTYTSFETHLLASAASPDGGADIRVRLRNTGAAFGDDVVQLYLDKPAHPAANAQFAELKLVAFERISLAPAESREVLLHVPAEQFRYWDAAKHTWASAGRERRLWLAENAEDHRTSFTVHGLVP